MLSLLNGIYQPRPGMIVSTDCPLESILKMWTDISGWPDRSKELSVNHFVPVLPHQHAELQNYILECSWKKAQRQTEHD
jgi:hypothetical protein